ncbi:MAG: CDP-diacylglycerol--glycerol-3-phosphate 3-phosphatidyltransferase [Micrococcales bacterium]|nr:MAG: CDP-diacylglycerol--glycerol-3-phosphate 3-phosphatidyltransferase [Micrococcales bacterium]PIE27287.1 MAG: CDP-diacylglycerol--glycerol-3-phosphate 3-phosphatidyltransferase [Micrococcales bacterium]
MMAQATRRPGRRNEPSAWNLPNALTMVRIVAVPVFVVLLVRQDGQDAGLRLWALGVFIAAMITDRLDGQIARSRGIVTDFGKLFDPIADKALMGAAFISLSVLDLIPWWMTLLVLFRELGITVLRFAIVRYGIMPANLGGKLKTTLQSVVVGIAVFPAELLLGRWVVAILWVLMLAVVAVTLWTGWDYVKQAVRMRASSRAAKHPHGRVR